MPNTVVVIPNPDTTTVENNPNINDIIKRIKSQPKGQNVKCTHKEYLVSAKTGETAKVEIEKIDRVTGIKEKIDCVPIAGVNIHECKCCETDIFGRKMKYFNGLSGSFCVPEFDQCNENVCSLACSSSTHSKKAINKCISECESLFPKYQKFSGKKQSNTNCCPSLMNYTGVRGDTYCVSEKDMTTCKQACGPDCLDDPSTCDKTCLNNCLNIDFCDSEDSGKLLIRPNKSSCKNDADCGANNTCVNGKCEDKSCSLSADCIAPATCFNGKCIEETCCPIDSLGRTIRQFNGTKDIYCLKSGDSSYCSPYCIKNMHLDKSCELRCDICGMACLNNNGTIDESCKTRCKNLSFN